MNEIEQENAETQTPVAELDGHVTEVAAETGAVPEVATIDAGAANAVAAAATANPALDPMTSSISNDWTEVPRDPAETDNGLKATPAANSSTNAWAESSPATSGETATPAPASWAEDVPAAVPAADEGFSEVQGRNRGGRGRGGRGAPGEFRGRGRGGRGRGGRGDGEFRGRGGRGGERRGGGGFRGGRGGAEGGSS